MLPDIKDRDPMIQYDRSEEAVRTDMIFLRMMGWGWWRWENYSAVAVATVPRGDCQEMCGVSEILQIIF